MSYKITKKDIILQQIREQKRYIMYHNDKIKSEVRCIKKNQEKIIKLEQKLKDIEKWIR